MAILDGLEEPIEKIKADAEVRIHTPVAVDTAVMDVAFLLLRTRF
jgi:hypothetical protein